MTPENLKQLAEAMGHGASVLGGKCFAHAFNDSFEFNPEHNAEQEREVLLWLLGKGWEVYKYFNDFAFSKGEILHIQTSYSAALFATVAIQMGWE